MVDVLVGQDGPLFGCHDAKEGVRVGSATAWTSGEELVEQMGQAGLFGGEVGLVWNDECWDGGGVAAHGLVVLYYFRFDEGAEDSSDKLTWRA